MLEWLLLTAAVTLTAPLKLSVRADIGKESTFEVIVWLYGMPVRFVGLISAMGVFSLRHEKGKREATFQIGQILSFYVHLFRAAEWSQAELRCRIGTGDAFESAMLAGGLSILLQAAGAPIHAHVDVRPEFTKAFFALSARCILSFRGGDIIRAGVRAFKDRAPMKKKAGLEDGKAAN